MEDWRLKEPSSAVSVQVFVPEMQTLSPFTPLLETTLPVTENSSVVPPPPLPQDTTNNVVRRDSIFFILHPFISGRYTVKILPNF